MPVSMHSLSVKIVFRRQDLTGKDVSRAQTVTHFDHLTLVGLRRCV